MLEFICPKCGKDTIPEILSVLPRRQYEILCKRCRTKFIVREEKAGAQSTKSSQKEK